MFPPRSPACPRARGPVRCPKGNLRPDLPTGTSPGQPLTWVFPAANCPGLCPVAPVGLTAGTLGSSAHPRRAAITAPTGEPVSCGTRPEHGGKQGIAQPATHSQPLQRRRLLCKQLFTTGFVARISPPAARYSALSQCHAANNCEASAAPPPSLASPGRQGGPGTIGRAAWGRRAPSITSHGSGLLAGGRWPGGCGQPPRSPDRPSKCFFPPNFLCPGPQPHAQSCSPGLCRAGARGRFPPPLTWGRGAALATFPRGCSNPQYFGTEASGLQAVYQEYPWVAMATWASPWEPEGRQSCKHPAGHKQALSSP